MGTVPRKHAQYRDKLQRNKGEIIIHSLGVEHSRNNPIYGTQVTNRGVELGLINITPKGSWETISGLP